MRLLVVSSLLAPVAALIVFACSSSSDGSSSGAAVDTGWRCVESGSTCNCEIHPATPDPAKTALSCTASGYDCCFRYVPATQGPDAGEEECTCSNDPGAADSVACAKLINNYANGSGGKYVGYDKRAACPLPK